MHAARGGGSRVGFLKLRVRAGARASPTHRGNCGCVRVGACECVIVRASVRGGGGSVPDRRNAHPPNRPDTEHPVSSRRPFTRNNNIVWTDLCGLL